MRYLEVSVHQPPSLRHPMHQFVVEEPGYSRSRLLHASVPVGESHAFVFHVDGPSEGYEAALRGVDRVETYELSPRPDGTFYLYVRERASEHGQQFQGAFTGPGLIVVLPIDYRADGTVRLTIVGPGGALQAALDETPDGMDASVLSIGEYDARRFDAGGALTDRQFEAVTAAVDCGYYGTPRSGSVAEVGDRLECSPSAAAELLRRAEKRVMHRLVDDAA
jgi:hypothetical protein